LKQLHYRSALMAKDYYKETKRVKYENYMGTMSRFEDRQALDASGPGPEVQLDGGAPRAGEISQGSDVTYIDGKINGTVRQYHDGGALASEVGYEDGVCHGYYRTYYPDGKLHNEKLYQHGKLNGIFKAWDEDGSLFFEIAYKNDKQHGPDRSYYRNGILQYEDIYENGKKVVRKTYDSTGKLKFVQNYH